MKKIISIITLFCFFTASVQNLSYASIAYENIFELETKNSLSNVLPSDFGNITFTNITNSKDIIINIQDLHSNISVQKNINIILNILTSQYNVKSIYIEGASGTVDISKIKNIHNQQIKTNISTTLLNTGILTGAEYFAMNDKKDIPFYGLEDKKIHQENIVRLSKMITGAEFSKKLLTRIKKDLNMLNYKYINSENQKFIHIINKYKNKKTDTQKFYSFLLNYANNISANPKHYNNITDININDYPNMQSFIKLSGAMKKQNFSKLSNEMRQILSLMKEKLSYKDYKKIIAETNVLSNLEKLILYINEFCKNNSIDLADIYPNLYSFIQNKIEVKNINFVDLIKEEEKIINTIKLALSYNSIEYEITFLCDFYNYLENALTNNLMSKDCGYFLKGIDSFKNLYPKYVVYNQIKDLEDLIDNAIQFYKTNDYRNDIFVKNIEKDIRQHIKANTNNNLSLQNKDIIIVITGGYHTKGLNELIAKKGISFISVMPNTAAANEKKNMYNNIIVEESKKYNKNALAFTIASQMEDSTLVNTLIYAGLQNNLPFEQVKQICQYIFGSQYSDKGNSFAVKVDYEDIVIEKRGNTAVLQYDKNIQKNTKTEKALMLLSNDIISSETNANIKFFLDLLQLTDIFKPFQNISMLDHDRLIKTLKNLFIFFVESMHIHFSQGFENTQIEEYINEKIINDKYIQNKELNGVAINTVRFFPKVFQEILYENDKTARAIQERIKKAKTGEIDDFETIYLLKHYNSALNISGLISGIIKDVLAFIKTSERTDNILFKNFFDKFVNISDIADYITVSVFRLDKDTKGISLGKGLVALSNKLKYPILIEALGHEFAHEMLLLKKDFYLLTGKKKNIIHETHSYLFSILFIQIFNNLITSISNDENRRQYDKFLLDPNLSYKDMLIRNTKRNKNLVEANEVHQSSAAFIDLLNKYLAVDGQVMSLQNLIYLLESVREVFEDDQFETLEYSTIFYLIAIEFAKKINPELKDISDSNYEQLINVTQFFNLQETDADILLIESFIKILLTGNSIQIEDFFKTKIIEPTIDFDKYRQQIRNLCIKNKINVEPHLFHIIENIMFAILGQRIKSLFDNKENRNKNITEVTKTAIVELQEFIAQCKSINFDLEKSLKKLLIDIQSSNNIKNLSSMEIEDIFNESLIFIARDFDMFTLDDNADLYFAINKILPEILQKYGQSFNLGKIIDAVIFPTVYKNIGVMKNILNVSVNTELVLNIIVDLFTALIEDFGLSFNDYFENENIQDYIKDKQTLAEIHVNTVKKMPVFLQDLLYNEDKNKGQIQNILGETTNGKKEFVSEYYLKDNEKTNALLSLILHDISKLFQTNGYQNLIPVPSLDLITIFKGQVATGVSNNLSIAVNPADNLFLNIIAHEFGHTLFTYSGFLGYQSKIIHELYAYVMGILTTTLYDNKDIFTQELLPVTYNNITDSEEHSLPKVILQLIINVKEQNLTGLELNEILKTCSLVIREDNAKTNNISLAYKILDILENNRLFMKNLKANSLTVYFEKILDEPEERKAKIAETLSEVLQQDDFLIFEEEQYLRTDQDNCIFINKICLNEIFDNEGTLKDGKEKQLKWLKELIRLEQIQQYDLSKEQIADNFNTFHQYFDQIQTMLSGPFASFAFTFNKDADKTIADGKEMIYINTEYMKVIETSKYLELLQNLIILRFLENKFNAEFKTQAKFAFYVNADNLSDIYIDLQKFSSSSNVYEYLKSSYQGYETRQKIITKAVDKIIMQKKFTNKIFYTNKIKKLIFIVENKNIEFTSIEFFKELTANSSFSVIKKIYSTLLEVYSYLVQENLLTFNSDFTNPDIQKYLTENKMNILNGINAETAKKMPSFIQQMLFENESIKSAFEYDREFVKYNKFKNNELNGLLNLMSKDIINIVARIYPDINSQTLSAQIFFISLNRLVQGANYGNNKIGISQKLINRYKHNPQTLIKEIMKTISHEIGHEDLILKGVASNQNLIDTLHELYAYLFEILLIKSYSKIRGIDDKVSLFDVKDKDRLIPELLDKAMTMLYLIKDFIIKNKDEHDQALDILYLLQDTMYQNIFTEEKIKDALEIIENVSHGIEFEDDNITKVITVEDMNIEALSFFMLLFLFAGNLEISLPDFLALSKALVIVDADKYDKRDILNAYAANMNEQTYKLIYEIIEEGNKKIEKLNAMLFSDKTFQYNGTVYGYSITSNKTENGLLKDNKLMIFFTPDEIKQLLTPNKHKINTIKKKAKLLTHTISENPEVFILTQKIKLHNENISFKSIMAVLKAPIKRALLTANFLMDASKMFNNLLFNSKITKKQNLNIVYYDNYDIIEPSKDKLSVFVTEYEPGEVSFELSEFVINGRNLRISYDLKNNLIIAYCPKASIQEIIDMTSQYIKSNILQNNNSANVKNIIVNSNLLTDSITYNLSQNNDAFITISKTFFELGTPAVDSIFKIDDIESIMFGKQIYDYIGTVSYEELIKILNDRTLAGNKILIDSEVFLTITKDNIAEIKKLLFTTKINIAVKVNLKEDIISLYDLYGLTEYMLESRNKDSVNRVIVEYNGSSEISDETPVSYIKLTDLSDDIETKLENIASHQAIVISIDKEAAENIDINSSMILNSLKTTLKRILKSKTINSKTAIHMGKEFAKQTVIADDVKEKFAQEYDLIKISLTDDEIIKLMEEFPEIFSLEIKLYIEKLFDGTDEQINDIQTAFLKSFINNILYDNEPATLQVIQTNIDNISYYKNLLSAA